MQKTGTSGNSEVLTPRYKRYKGTFPRRKRIYPINIGEILKTLKAEGCPIAEETFKKLMIKEQLFMMTRRGKRWTCQPYEARLIVELVKEWYGKKNLFSDSGPL